jgi:hypothetical protein
MTDYNRTAIRAALWDALEPFIPATTNDSGKAAVVDAVADVAVFTLRLVCGAPDGKTPTGIISDAIGKVWRARN